MSDIEVAMLLEFADLKTAKIAEDTIKTLAQKHDWEMNPMLKEFAEMILPDELELSDVSLDDKVLTLNMDAGREPAVYLGEAFAKLSPQRIHIIHDYTDYCREYFFVNGEEVTQVEYDDFGAQFLSPEEKKAIEDLYICRELTENTLELTDVIWDEESQRWPLCIFRTESGDIVEFEGEQDELNDFISEKLSGKISAKIKTGLKKYGETYRAAITQIEDVRPITDWSALEDSEYECWEANVSEDKTVEWLEKVLNLPGVTLNNEQTTRLTDFFARGEDNYYLNLTMTIDVNGVTVPFYICFYTIRRFKAEIWVNTYEPLFELLEKSGLESF